jgi:hypothetical protein
MNADIDRELEKNKQSISTKILEFCHAYTRQYYIILRSVMYICKTQQGDCMW